MDGTPQSDGDEDDHEQSNDFGGPYDGQLRHLGGDGGMAASDVNQHDKKKKKKDKRSKKKGEKKEKKRAKLQKLDEGIDEEYDVN